MKIVMFCFNNLILIAIRRRSAHCHCYQSQSCVPELPGLAPVCWLKISILIFSLRCEVSVSCVFETLAFQTKSYHWSVICTPPALECNVCAVLCTMIGYPPPLPCLWLVTGHGCTPAHWRQLAPSVRTEIDTIEQRRLGRRRGDDTISQSEARDAPRDPIRGRQMCPDIPGNANVGDKGSGAVTTSKIWCQMPGIGGKWSRQQTHQDHDNMQHQGRDIGIEKRSSSNIQNKMINIKWNIITDGS